MKQQISANRLLVVLFVVSMGLASCGNQPGTIEGTVTGARWGEPVSQAKIDIFALEKPEDVSNLQIYEKEAILQEQLTDENGTFSISLAPGTYVLQVWVQDLEVANQMVEIRAGRATKLDLRVEIPSP
jgi:hypothetical protein